MKIELNPGEEIYIQMGEHTVIVQFNKGRQEPDVLVFSSDPVEFGEAIPIGYEINKPAYIVQVIKQRSDRT